MKTFKRLNIRFKSKSDPSTWYNTFRAKDGKVACTCKGFMWNQKCWHVEKIKSMAS